MGGVSSVWASAVSDGDRRHLKPYLVHTSIRFVAGCVDSGRKGWAVGGSGSTTIVAHGATTPMDRYSYFNTHVR